MSVNAGLILLLTLLPFIACTLGAEDAVTFPTYKEGEASFPTSIDVPPVFSGNGNYGLVASGDTLYHMELRHGRIHGKTFAGGTIKGLAVGTGSQAFAIYDDQLLRIDGFDVTSSCELTGIGVAMTVCGNDPVVLLDDGSLVLHDGTDLTFIGSYIPENPGMACIQGFPGIVVTGFSDGTMISLSLPSFSEIAAEKLNSSLIFMAGAGQENLIFSIDAWNEVAVCSPADLIIQVMFTFPETPLSAASDSELSCVYAVCPSAGIHVCLSNGEIAWRTDEFGGAPFVTLSDDCEIALVSEGNTVTLLLK
ncbi:MAG: hypothetical protein K8S62_14335 [Candidatus Sabulitectum sp.]|nr:hypothetical protein [Candidatus Sabulitectum sp.]